MQGAFSMPKSTPCGCFSYGVIPKRFKGSALKTDRRCNPCVGSNPTGSSIHIMSNTRKGMIEAVKIEIISGILHQWDVGRRIRVVGSEETVSEIHFAHHDDESAIVVEPSISGENITANIPNILLQSEEDIAVYLVNASNGVERTIGHRCLHVVERPKPADYVYTETEVLTYKTLEERIANLEDAVVDEEQIADAVKEYLAENPIEGGNVTEEQISQAVEAYMEENPVDCGISPVEKTEDMTQPVGIDENGKLWVAPVGEQSDENDNEEVGIPNDDSDLIGDENIFAGRTASFYGDSLTEVNGHYSKGYHEWVKDLLCLASYDNYGVSGYKVSDVYNKVSEIDDASDIIFVMCGVNDQTFHVPLGTESDTTTGTTYGSLNLLCALLKEKYPTKLVVFITPHYQTKYPSNKGVTSYEVTKAIRVVCEKYAIPVYDNFVFSGIYPTNLGYWTTDNCHWNDNAHRMVGHNLARFVETTFAQIPGNCRIVTELTAASLTNTAVEVAPGESYTTSISVEDGYSIESVTVAMCGRDITSEVYLSNNISIPEVCGNVVITVVAKTEAEMGKVIYPYAMDLTRAGQSMVVNNKTIFVSRAEKTLPVGGTITKFKYAYDSSVLEEQEVKLCLGTIDKSGGDSIGYWKFITDSTHQVTINSSGETECNIPIDKEGLVIGVAMVNNADGKLYIPYTSISPKYGLYLFVGADRDWPQYESLFYVEVTT